MRSTRELENEHLRLIHSRMVGYLKIFFLNFTMVFIYCYIIMRKIVKNVPLNIILFISKLLH